MNGNSSGGGTIEIIITADGKTRLQTHGFSGASCRDASRFVEEALGRPTRETLTAEFHESVALNGSAECAQGNDATAT
ncbi:MAG: DUF2997 domain-containing protein [Planctomycetaceae bacterium]